LTARLTTTAKAIFKPLLSEGLRANFGQHYKELIMRKIEQQMLDAIRNLRNWRLDNTEVKVTASHPASCLTIEVLLHGNLIAVLSGADKYLTVMESTLLRWPTPTTKSRLRALGANVTTKKGTTYLNGSPVIPY
jgi:hypothetical protein